MEVFDAARTVLAVREFQDKPVSPEAARRIVQAVWPRYPTGRCPDRG